MIHNLVQICHSFVQSKIGSGFDILAVVYGSHVYTRFDKHFISNVMDQLTNDFSNGGRSKIGLKTDVCELTVFNTTKLRALTHRLWRQWFKLSQTLTYSV